MRFHLPWSYLILCYFLFVTACDQGKSSSHREDTDDDQGLDSMVFDLGPLDQDEGSPSEDQGNIATPDAEVEFSDAEVDPPMMGHLTVSGAVLDTRGLPVEEAQIFFSHERNINILSDERGLYSIEVSRGSRLTLNVVAPGYVPIHKVINLDESMATDEQMTPLNLRIDHVLADVATPVPIDITEGGRAESLGATLTLAPLSLERSDGTPVEGEVNVELTPFDVTTAELNFMPGDFTGVTDTGEEVHIESYGFAKIRVLEGDEEVQLREGMTATLELPIAELQVERAPELIPLWNFDEDLGTWILKGVATKSQTEDGRWVYTAELISFGSFWNCDEIMEVVDLAFFIADIFLWLNPGTAGFKLALRMAVETYQIISLIRAIQNLDPDNATVGEIATIVFGVSGKLRLLKSNPIEGRLINAYYMDLNELERLWTSYGQEHRFDPTIGPLIPRGDRYLSQLVRSTNRYEDVSYGGILTEISMVVEEERDRLIEFYPSYRSEAFPNLTSLNEEGTVLSKLDELYSVIEEIDIEDPRTASNPARCLEMIDELYAFVFDTARILMIDLSAEAEPEEIEEREVIRSELNILYERLETLDQGLSLIDQSWAPALSERYEVKVSGRDYQGITSSYSDRFGFVRVSARFGSTVGISIEGGDFESEPLEVTTPLVPGDERFLGFIYPQLKRDLTALDLHVRLEDGSAAGSAKLTLAGESYPKVVGPLYADADGFACLLLPRSEVEGEDLDGDGILNEINSAILSVLYEGVSYSFDRFESPTEFAAPNDPERSSRVVTLASRCVSGIVVTASGEFVSDAVIRAGTRESGLGTPVLVTEEGYFELLVQRSENMDEDLDQDGQVGEYSSPLIVVERQGNSFIFDAPNETEFNEATGCAELGMIALEDRTLDSNLSVMGLIDFLGKRYRYELEIPGERILEVELSNAPSTSSPVDYRVSFFDEQGNRINEMETILDYNGSNGTTELVRSYYIPSSRVILIQVQDRFDDDIDLDQAFTLTATLYEVPDGSTEPANNSTENATPLTIGETAQGYLSHPQDDDYYAIELDGESLLRVNASSASERMRLNVLVSPESDVNFNCISSDGTYPPSSLSKICYIPSAGRYFIRLQESVVGSRYDYEVPYQVSFETLPVLDAEFEPNDTQETATPILLGEINEGYLTHPRDEDYYAIEVDRESVIRVTASSLSEQLRLNVWINAQEGVNLNCYSRNGTVPPSSITQECNLDSAGRYYVRIQEGNGRTQYDLDTPYQFTVEQLP